MKYIVMSTEQKDGLENLRQAYLNEGGKPFEISDFAPIEIETKDDEGNPYYILPTSVLSDPELEDFYAYVNANKKSEIVIREVAKSEFKVYEI